MLKRNISKIESYYFDKMFMMFIITNSDHTSGCWSKENTETIILDCDGY